MKMRDLTGGSVFGTLAAFSVHYLLCNLAQTLLLQLLAEPLLRRISTPAESLLGALVYLRICIGGMVFTVIFNAMSAVLRGLGNFTSPLLFITIACALNVSGDFFLVGTLGMGAKGAAIATVAAQAASVGIRAFFARRKGFSFLRREVPLIKREKVRELFQIGLPISLQDTLVMASFILITSIVNQLGYVAAAASGICDRFISIATIPAFSFSAALSAIVSQNLGAGQSDRAKVFLKASLFLSAAAALAATGILWRFSAAIAGLFSKEPEVIDQSLLYLIWYKYEYPVFAAGICMSGFANGIGRTRFTLWSNVVSAYAVRVPLLFLVAGIPGATLYHIGVVLPIASAVFIFIGIGFLYYLKYEQAEKAGELSQI